MVPGVPIGKKKFANAKKTRKNTIISVSDVVAVSSESH